MTNVTTLLHKLRLLDLLRKPSTKGVKYLVTNVSMGSIHLSSLNVHKAASTKVLDTLWTV